MLGFYTEADYENSIIELLKIWVIVMFMHLIWNVTSIALYMKKN